MTDKKIKLLVMDVDGTLTDGKIYIGINGELMKSFDIKDGYAIHDLLPNNGIIPIWITARNSEIVMRRAKELGVEMVYQGVRDKLDLLKNIADESECSFEEIAYIGDDIGDIACIKACGYSGCPQDAADEVKAYTDYIAIKNGGAGAVREFASHIIELINNANSELK